MSAFPLPSPPPGPDDPDLLRRAEAALPFAFFEHAGTGLALFDTRLRYLRVNRALARINGVAAADHVGRRIGDVLPGIDDEASEAVLREALRTRRPVVERVVRGTLGPERRPHARRLSGFPVVEPDGTLLGAGYLVIEATEQVRAVDELESAREHLALVSEAGVRVGTTLDLRTTAEQITRLAVPGFADFAMVDLLQALLPERDQQLDEPLQLPVLDESTRGTGMAPVAYRLAATGTIKVPFGGADALRAGASAWYLALPRFRQVLLARRATIITGGAGVLTEAEDHALSPNGVSYREMIARTGVRSVIMAPMTARGTVLGMVVLARTAARPDFDREDLRTAQALATRAALSVDNARLYERERHQIAVLQRQLLPPGISDIPNMPCAVRYLTGRQQEMAGGDWYDLVPLAHGRAVLSVGDVTGHGVDATALMGSLRIAASTLATVDITPATALAHLDGLVRRNPGEMLATCQIARYDPIADTLTVANAGHPSPIVVRPGAEPEFLDLPAGLPLGLAGTLVARDATIEVDVPPGTLVLLYTDGLVEARGRPIDDGLEHLRAAVANVALRDPGTVCDAALAARADPDGSDDVALLAIRFGGMRRPVGARR